MSSDYKTIELDLGTEKSVILTEVTAMGKDFRVPDEITHIARHAFNGCILNKITIPGHVTLDPYAFYNCQADELIFEDGVEKIPDATFESSIIEKIVLPKTIESIGSDVFKNVHDALKTLIIDKSAPLKDIPADFLYNCSGLEEITLPDAIEIIKPRAFYCCSGLESITLPKNLKEIQSFAFCNCMNLKEIVIPEGTEYISWNVFHNCINLEKITLPKTLKQMRYDIFFNCHKLKEITLPDSLVDVSGNVFNSLPTLEEIENKEAKAPFTVRLSHNLAKYLPFVPKYYKVDYLDKTIDELLDSGLSLKEINADLQSREDR